mmetsp:Transcript_58514/g.161944  ORF Transcript_58514/g.161944 Transcript_58514/m.161944 type:complete len:461 (+) Transcript_58514:3-1385(+)
MLEFSVGGRLRGVCRRCDGCPGWVPPASGPWLGDGAAAPAPATGAEVAPESGARAPSPHNCAGPPWPYQERTGIHDCGTAIEPRCGHCGCAEEVHEDVTHKFAAYVQRGIPIAALHWRQVEFDLWRDTDGLFQPDGRLDDIWRTESCEGVLVSVVCPTTASRRPFHSFLWMCWKIQTHTPKQLVVVDTCEDEPSEFFMSKMSEDPRIVYRHFRVPERRWSIGLKRNLACYLASGQVIAHFDDDDMYGRTYLEDMVRYLCHPKAAFDSAFSPMHDRSSLFPKMLTSMGVSSPVWDTKSLEDALAEVSTRVGLGRFGAACAKLSCWHTYTLRTRSWSVFDACDDEDRELFGWGFSFVYLRAVWQECPFAHMGLGEDYDFVRRLKQSGLPVILVYDDKGICAHTCHLDNTSGGDPESRRRYGSSSQMYSQVASLVGLFEAAAKGILAAQETYRSKQGSLRQVA